MKEASVEWLFNKLWKTPKDKFEWQAILKEAKDKHEVEIIRGTTRGFLAASDELPLNDALAYAQQYYNLNYKNERDKIISE